MIFMTDIRVSQFLSQPAARFTSLATAEPSSANLDTFHVRFSTFILFISKKYIQHGLAQYLCIAIHTEYSVILHAYEVEKKNQLAQVKALP